MSTYATINKDSGDTLKIRRRHRVTEESKLLFKEVIKPLLGVKPPEINPYLWLEYLFKPHKREITCYVMRKDLKTSLIKTAVGFKVEESGVIMPKGMRFLIRDITEDSEYLDIELNYDKENSRLYKIRRSKFKELFEFFLMT
jgi:hypothetical protein